MGSTESVPQAYEFTGLDGPWLSIARLALEARPGDGRRRGRPGDRKRNASPDARRPALPPAELRTRRLRLRNATLELTLEQMNRALGAVPLGDAGVSDARMWMAPDGPRLVGTFSVGNRKAPFTVRPTVDAGALGRRRIRIGLSDVRVYGALPLPASLIGVALAGAINGAISEAGPHIHAVGPHLDVDLLALALEQTLVARGWRVPDLRSGRLEGVESIPLGLGGGALRLKFRGDASGGERMRPGRLASDDGDRDLPLVPTVEGERLPDVALDAEGHLNAGDVVAAEMAFRSIAREAPEVRPVQARLLALHAAAGGDDVAELAAALTAKWPEFVPGWLYAAIAAREAGDPARSAEAFHRVATLCERRDEREDARLARAGEAAARAAADQIRATMPARRPPISAASEITEQDQPRDLDAGEAGADEALEITQQDEPPEEVAAAPGRGDTEGDGAPAAVQPTGPTDEAEQAAAAERGEHTGAPEDAPRTAGASAETETKTETETETETETDADSVTARAEAAYAQEDPEARATALGQVLEEIEALPTGPRHAAYTRFGRVAESSGDPEHAEEAYWRATRLAGDPRRRADDLLAHARVLIARGNTAAAITELEEALVMVPNHAGTLALLADRAFQARNWERARHYYALLDGAPDADEVVPRETLLDRRAGLARAAGDGAEAEACYRELALLNPRHLEPRQALAELALARDDLRTATAWWEEVLRLLPGHALEAVLDVRQRLADLHARLGDWGSARTYAELVLAQDPGRVALLERMAEIDERLERYPAAVEALGRLARLYQQPRQRAQALFRQGEILLERMNDPARAFDAHLKASDLDPTHTPTVLRLIEGYWRAGDFAEAAAVGEELRRGGALSALTPLLRARWALALALGTRDSGPQALADSGLGAEPWSAGVAATALSEAAALLVGRAPRELEAATAVLEAWSLQDATAETAASTAAPLPAALAAAVAQDPATPGAARALAWLADREGNTLAARVFYAVAAFAEDGDGAAGRLDELGLAPAPPEAALALLGPADHATLSSRAAPLRRTLAALAHALAGFDGTAAPATDAAPAALSGSQLAIEVQADYAALARAMDAPPVALIPAADHRQVGSGPVSRGVVPPGGLRVVPGRPATIAIPAGMVGLQHDQLTFLVARALDHLRSGLALAAHAGATTADEVGQLLHGAWAALTGTPLEQTTLARSVAEALGDRERRNALMAAGGEGVVEDLVQARELAADWAAFREGAERAADRFAALACRNPLAALRALYRADSGAASANADVPERERRVAFLRTGHVRELLRFLSSAQYAHALGLAPDATT